MAGASIQLTVRDTDVRRAMARLSLKEGGVVQAALKNIGEQLLKSTRRRFAEQRDPTGRPWAPLNPAYAAAKKGGKILSLSRQLFGSLVYQVSGNVLRLGTNKIYAAPHQFGAVIVPRSGDFLAFRIGGRLVIARKVTIPARPFLGISAADKEEIAAVVEDHVNEVWEGRE